MGGDGSRLQLCIEWGGSRNSSESAFLCLSRYDEALENLVAIAVTDHFRPNAAISFTPAFVVDWTFEHDQEFCVQLCDDVSGNKRVLSDCKFTVGEAVAARRLRHPLLRQLVPTRAHPNAPTATVMLVLQKDAGSCVRVFRMHASCHEMHGTDALLEVQFLGDRFVGEGRSRNNSQCEWKMRTCVTEALAGNGQAEDDVPLLISLSRPESVRSLNAVPKLKVRSSIRALGQAAVANRPLLLSASGGAFEMRVHACTFDYEISLFDRIAAGLEINSSFAVDFTISNGDQRNPSSLHFLGDDANVYQRVMATFMQHLQPYSNAQRIAMLGFGAQLQDGTVSNCFSLNGRAHHPRCDGAAAALQAYATALASVNFSGPTCIAPAINAAVAMHCEVWGSESLAKEYHVMFIVLDTPCRDLQVRSLAPSSPLAFTPVVQDTVDAVVNSTFWPISIVMASHCPLCPFKRSLLSYRSASVPPTSPSCRTSLTATLNLCRAAPAMLRAGTTFNL